MIAQLAVAAAVYAIDKPYSYRVPEGMQVQPGLRVLVPFGRGNRRSEAVVLALQDTAQRDLKVIERALDDAPILSQAQLQLAAFMKERYFCTFYEAVKAILPAGFWFAEKKTLTLPKEIRNIVKCKNPRCITSIEQELDQVFVLTDPRKEVYRCKYCEEKYKRK